MILISVVISILIIFDLLNLVLRLCGTRFNEIHTIYEIACIMHRVTITASSLLRAIYGWQIIMSSLHLPDWQLSRMTTTTVHKFKFSAGLLISISITHRSSGAKCFSLRRSIQTGADN